MPFEMTVLHRPDRRVTLVVENEELEGQFEPGHGLQLLNVQLKAAIAVHADGALSAACEAPPDACRETEAHRPKTPGAERSLPLLWGKGKPERVDGRPR